MEFTRIKDFLEVYRKNLLKEEGNRADMCDIIRKISGIHIPEEAIVFKKSELVIKGHPVQKNEIFLYREKIITALQEEGYKISQIS